MYETPLPLPNPGDWCSVRYAAHHLGISAAQLYRLIASRILTPYHLTGSTVMMLWRAEVDDLAAARARVGGPGAVRARKAAGR